MEEYDRRVEVCKEEGVACKRTGLVSSTRGNISTK